MPRSNASPPPNPGGWLTTTAGNRAIDRIRREKQRDAKHQAALMQYDDTPHEAKLARLHRLQSTLERHARAVSLGMVGTVQRILVEGVYENLVLMGLLL